jgi:hypothetical protein
MCIQFFRPSATGRMEFSARLVSKEKLTLAEYNALADVPPELEWLANITNQKTRRAYKVDVAEFMVFTGLPDHTALRIVARACYRLAQGDGGAPARYRKHPAQAFGVVIIV